jgi:hypothetical protein
MWSLPRTGQVISTGAMAGVFWVSVAACGTGSVHVPSGAGCTIERIDGDLVEQGGRTALSNSRWAANSQSFDGPLVWPDGWSLRTVDGGALEVVDPAGGVRARTGTRISISAASDNSSPMVTAGQLLVCPNDPFGLIDAD